jgi:hypothetical protein
VIEQQLKTEGYGFALVTLESGKLAAPALGIIYPRFWVLASILLIFGLLSVPMAAHLFDNLKPGPYRNLFTQLEYLRGILYFGLGLEGLAWYHNALSDLKRECISGAAQARSQDGGQSLSLRF